MQVHQYIYTRLPKELSPHGKDGFQSVFVPPDFFPAGTVMELESRIHFPSVTGFTEKRVVFWQEIHQQQFLVILFVQSLPEETDAHGRGGIFLCQGFFVPPALWESYPSPLAVADLLAPYRLRSLDAVLNSSCVDRETGSIAPIEVDTASLPQAAEAIGPLLPYTTQLLRILPLLEANKVSLVLKGSPSEVEKALDQALALTAFPLKTQLGWDSAFDGGRLHFSPFWLFGYSAQAPTTGAPVELDLATGMWTPEDTPRTYLSIDRPVDVWLRYQYAPTTTWTEWADIKELAGALESGPMAPSRHWYLIADLLIIAFLRYPSPLRRDAAQDWPHLLEIAQENGHFSTEEIERLERNLPFHRHRTSPPTVTDPDLAVASEPNPAAESSSTGFLSKLWRKISGK